MYYYRPTRIADLWYLLLHEREEAAKRCQAENCLKYIADLCWVLATGQRVKRDAIKPYTTMCAEMDRQSKALKAPEEEDFRTILERRIAQRKGGETK